jgi:hypothetical protein
MEKKELSIANERRSAGVDLSDENLSIEFQKVRDDSEPTMFMLTTFNNNKVSLNSSGRSFDDLSSGLNDDEIFFGVIRVTISERVKFFTFSYIGANVNGMRKGKASLAKSGVMIFFEGSHGEISLGDNLSDISRDAVTKKIAVVSREADISFP